jgi:hypothetical protein
MFSSNTLTNETAADAHQFGPSINIMHLRVHFKVMFNIDHRQ